MNEAQQSPVNIFASRHPIGPVQDGDISIYTAHSPHGAVTVHASMHVNGTMRDVTDTLPIKPSAILQAFDLIEAVRHETIYVRFTLSGK